MDNTNTPGGGGGGFVITSRQTSEFLTTRNESVLLPGEVRVPADLKRPTPIDWTRIDSVNFASGTPLDTHGLAAATTAAGGASASGGAGDAGNSSSSATKSGPSDAAAGAGGISLDVSGHDDGFDWGSTKDSLQWDSPNNVVGAASGASGAGGANNKQPDAHQPSAVNAAAAGPGGGPLLQTPPQQFLGSAPWSPSEVTEAAAKMLAEHHRQSQQQQQPLDDQHQQQHQFYADQQQQEQQQQQKFQQHQHYGVQHQHQHQHHHHHQQQQQQQQQPSRRSTAQMHNEELLRQSKLFPVPPAPPLSMSGDDSAVARFELWHYHASQWDITHSAPPPPRNPKHFVNVTNDPAAMPYTADFWMDRCAHYAEAVQRGFRFPPSDNALRPMCAPMCDEAVLLENAVVA